MLHLLEKEEWPVCSLEESLGFFSGETNTEKVADEYQKVSLSALTICCTCD